MSETTLVAALQREVGSALRSVGRYEKRDRRVVYIREDVEATYDAEDIEAIFDDLTLQGMSKRHLEELFHAGQLHCTMLHFDDALLFHFVESDTAGLLVSVETGHELDIEAVTATCRAHL